MAPTNKPNIMLFHERGDDIAALFGTDWTMDVFTSDFPAFVRDVPAVYEIDTGAVHCGRDAVRAFHERHTPRPKARERAAAPPPPKKSVTIDTVGTTSTVPTPVPAKEPANADVGNKEKTVSAPLPAPTAASPAPTTSLDAKQTTGKQAEPKKKAAPKKRTSKAP